MVNDVESFLSAAGCLRCHEPHGPCRLGSGRQAEVDAHTELRTAVHFIDEEVRKRLVQFSQGGARSNKKEEILWTGIRTSSDTAFSKRSPGLAAAPVGLVGRKNYEHR